MCSGSIYCPLPTADCRLLAAHCRLSIGRNACPVADASILSPKGDGVIMSYQIGRIGREVLKRSKLRLGALGGQILGIIMSDIQAEID